MSRDYIHTILQEMERLRQCLKQDFFTEFASEDLVTNLLQVHDLNYDNVSKLKVCNLVLLYEICRSLKTQTHGEMLLEMVRKFHTFKPEPNTQMPLPPTPEEEP